MEFECIRFRLYIHFPTLQADTTTEDVHVEHTTATEETATEGLIVVRGNTVTDGAVAKAETCMYDGQRTITSTWQQRIHHHVNRFAHSSTGMVGGHLFIRVEVQTCGMHTTLTT